MWDSGQSCDISQFFGSPAAASLATSLLLSSNAEAGLFSRITMTSMTGAWYTKIGHFEAILVGLVILQILVMRYMLILPLDLSKWVNEGILIGTAVSKRKRRSLTKMDQIVETQRLVNTILTAVKRLDEGDCLLQSLCQLQWQKSAGYSLPSQISQTLSTLKRMGENRWEYMPPAKIQEVGNEMSSNRSVIMLLEEAVLFGNQIWLDDSNSTISCERRYSLCPLKESEVMKSLSSYFSILKFI